MSDDDRRRAVTERLMHGRIGGGSYRQRVRAAWELHQETQLRLAHAACEMRGDGWSWDDVAAELPWPSDECEGYSPGALLFEWVADVTTTHESLFDRYVAWTCHTCGRSVRDYGPYNGHPADTERGHAEDCIRHSEDIDRYVAWRDTDLYTAGPE